MLLKRKRSESEFSFSSASTFYSPPRPDPSRMNVIASPRPLSSQSTTRSHLSSRTMKRFRNSRPSDEEVHQRTLSLLYKAQKPGVNPHQQHEKQQQQHPQQHSHQQHHHNVQSSLHSFWNLPRPAPLSTINFTTSSPAVDSSMYAPANCEDCGETLGDAGDGDVMDIDGEGETSCGACGKHVCSHCSITNLCEQRRCLMCASRKK